MKNGIKILNHIIFAFGCMFMLATIYEHWTTVLLCGMVSALAVVCCYFLRKRVKKMWVFLMTHFIGIFGTVGLSFFGLPQWFIAVSVLLTIYSVTVRLVEKAEFLDEPNYFFVGLMIFLYFVLDIYGKIPGIKMACIWIAGVLFLLKVFYDNLEASREYVAMRKLSAEVDEKTVTTLSNRLSLIYTIGLGVLLMVVGIIANNAKTIWSKVGEWLKQIVRYLMNLLFDPEDFAPPQEEPQVEDKAEGLVDMFQGLMEEGERSPFLQILEKILVIVVIVALVTLTIIVVARIVMLLYRYFYRTTERENDNQVVEILEERVAIPKERKRFSLHIEHNPAKRIRKIYKKQLKRIGEQRIERLRYMTPDEQLKFLREKEVEETAIKEIQALYEKARYSKETIQESDVARFALYYKM